MTTIHASAMLTQSITQSITPPPFSSKTSSLGLPQLRTRGGRVRSCASKEEIPIIRAKSIMIAAAGCVMSITRPLLALVDERMSTEGTGLTLGLSNNLLGWILFGVFGLIWSLYFVYASGLDEDDDSGLSL